MEATVEKPPPPDSIVDINSINDEQLLGSLTTYNNTEGSDVKSQQIRSSARVFKKMKLDLTPSTAAPATPTVDKPKEKEPKVENKKCYRPLWTSDDKTIFFEALNEFGKDFDSIQTYISGKLRKKGVPENQVKSKEQVRHLYHRTWQKISKYVKFSEGIKKVVQELYVLINYGELRKKIGSVNEKYLVKLNELVYTGSTNVRKMGKTIRIKTPMCRALRRLNQLDDNYDEINLPTRVTVELRPKDMISYLKVQLMAQNPRIKTTLPLQKRLSALIACVNKRWKSVEAMWYEKAINNAVNGVTTKNHLKDVQQPFLSECLPSQDIIDANKNILSPNLRLTPPENSKIEIPSINLSEYLTQQSICLTSYESRAGIKSCNDEERYNYKNSPKKGFRQRTDSLSDKSPQKSSSENDSVPVLQQEEEGKSESTEKVENLEQKKREIQINNIRKGWIEEECQTLTVGEVYLMIGSDSKIVLEYSWDKPEVKEEKPKNEELGEDEGIESNSDVSQSLRKLLSVAKLHYRKNMIKCPCGHVCGSKNNSQIKKNLANSKVKSKADNDLNHKDNGEGESFTAPHPVSVQNSSTYFPTTPSVTPMVRVITQLERLQPRYNNNNSRRGRKSRSQQVVVERKLPLQPNNNESEHQIVRMNIISKEETKPPTQSVLSIPTEEENAFKAIGDSQTDNLFQNGGPSTSNSVLLEQNGDNANSTLLIERDSDALSTAPPSPTRLLKENDGQSWINAEVADYSLSSLLGQLESPMKSQNEDLSSQVEEQLHSLLTETSVDFAVNFADLAAQVANDMKKA